MNNTKSAANSLSARLRQPEALPVGNYGENYETVQKERARYMAKEISHQEYYCWLSDFVGLTDGNLPRIATPERVKSALASGDEHLNTILLQSWDGRDPGVRSAAARAGVKAWSLCDTVCCLKAYAKRRAEKE